MNKPKYVECVNCIHFTPPIKRTGRAGNIENVEIGQCAKGKHIKERKPKPYRFGSTFHRYCDTHEPK